MATGEQEDAAPYHAVPTTQLASLELPFTLSPSGSSHAAAIARLGGPSRLSAQLEAKDSNDPVEMQLSPQSSPWAHPVPGDFVRTANVLVKVTKKKRKDGTGAKMFKVEPVGVIKDTVRFRGMPDFQYMPDMEDPVSKLSVALKTMDVDGIKGFRFPPETEDYEAGLRLFPPPLFSRVPLPAAYGYKPAPTSYLTTYTRADGTEIERLANRTANADVSPIEIAFDADEVPQTAPPEALKMLTPEDHQVLDRLKAMFAERPCWTRQAASDALQVDPNRVYSINKNLWACVGYRFPDGPFRDVLIRYGYDPRKHPEARFYQPMKTRKMTAKAGKRKPVPGTAGDKAASQQEPLRPSQFDGTRLSPRHAYNFQLCDISDPLLTTLIQSPRGVMPFCSPRNGWYTTSAFNQIRAVLKRKIAGLAEGKSRVVGDVECGELLAGDVAPTAEDLEVGQGRRDRAGSGAEEGTPSEAPVASGSKQKQGATLAMDKGKARAQKVPVRGTPMVVVPPLPASMSRSPARRAPALPAASASEPMDIDVPPRSQPRPRQDGGTSSSSSRLDVEQLGTRPETEEWVDEPEDQPERPKRDRRPPTRLDD